MLAAILLCCTMAVLTSCKSKSTADLVVYGKIFTSDNNQIVEAFAVKDGKYIYVGDKAGAEVFIEEGKTEVIWTCTLRFRLCHPDSRNDG